MPRIPQRNRGQRELHFFARTAIAGAVFLFTTTPATLPVSVAELDTGIAVAAAAPAPRHGEVPAAVDPIVTGAIPPMSERVNRSDKGDFAGIRVAEAPPPAPGIAALPVAAPPPPVAVAEPAAAPSGPPPVQVSLLPVYGELLSPGSSVGGFGLAGELPGIEPAVAAPATEAETAAATAETADAVQVAALADAAAPIAFAEADAPAAVEDMFRPLFFPVARPAIERAEPDYANDHDWMANPIPASARTAPEIRCLAEAIYFEARSEPIEGQLAVAQVVVNRLKNPAYPDTVCDVVYQNDNWYMACQFSFACDGVRDVVREYEEWETAQALARSVLMGEADYLDEVGAATHYHATYVRPNWAPTMQRMTQIGLHVFYRTYGGGWI